MSSTSTTISSNVRGLEVLRRPGVLPGEEDLAQVRAAFEALRTSPGARLLVAQCRPTAAFARRDLLRPGAQEAHGAVTAAGFTPAVRHVGGHLAAYDECSLVMHLWADHEEPTRDLNLRFRVLSQAVRDALEHLGVADARVGAVPGEYCDGEWSVNVGGGTKVAGTGQRISRNGWMWSAVLAVEPSEAVRNALIAGYRALALDLDPTTIGAASDHLNGARDLTVREVADAVTAALRRVTAEYSLLEP